MQRFLVTFLGSRIINSNPHFTSLKAHPGYGERRDSIPIFERLNKFFVGGQIDASEECLWVTDDGGTTWTAFAFTGSTTADGEVRRFRQCPRASRQHKVWIHGANNGSTRRYGPGTSFRMFRTLDGGGSSERMDLVTNSGLSGLSVVDINHAWACGEPTGGFGEIQRFWPS